MSRKQRRPPLPAHGQRVMVQARYTELCNRFPGPAAFIDVQGRVLDMNDDAPPLLDALEALPGGLRGLATAIGAFPRFDAMETGSGAVKRLEVALIPMSDGVLVLARDRSLTDNLNDALAESRKRYKDLVDISSDFAWEVDAEGVFVFVSPRGALGYAVRDLIGQRADAMLPLADAEPGSASSPFASRERVEDAPFWLTAADGEPALVSISSLPLFDSAGRWSGARGVARDITEVNQRENELADNETRDRLHEHLGETPVSVSAQFRPVELTADEVVKLSVGDVIPLSHPLDEPLTLVVGGTPTHRARIGRKNRRLAVQIEGIVDPTAMLMPVRPLMIERGHH